MNKVGFFRCCFLFPLFILLGNPITVRSAPFGLPRRIIFGGILISERSTITEERTEKDILISIADGYFQVNSGITHVTPII